MGRRSKGNNKQSNSGNTAVKLATVPPANPAIVQQMAQQWGNTTYGPNAPLLPYPGLQPPTHNQYLNIIPDEQRSNEWFTPYKYVEAARQVMNGIDLDPASCAFANQVVKAKCYYTKEQDGLKQKWYGRVWLNPPYGTTNGKSNLGVFTRRLIKEYQCGNVEQAVIVTSTKSDTSWFNLLWQYPICFANHLVEFYRIDHKRALHPLGTAFTYLGAYEDKFIEVFSQFGHVARSVSPIKSSIQTLTLWEVQGA